MNLNIIFRYLDPTKGGIESIAFYLYKEFSKKYVMHGVSMEVDEDIKLKGVTYFPESHAGVKFFFERSKWQYDNSMNPENTFNVCMTWPNAIGAYRAKKKYGTPYICLVHGDDVYLQGEEKTLKERIVQAAKRACAKRVLEYADALCINSKNTQKILHKTIKNEREIIIHPGVNFVELNTTWKKKDEFVIFSIGRYVERKGFRNVLLAMPQMKKNIPNIKYIMAGDGPLRDEFGQMVDELELQDCVMFAGRVSENEKYHLYQQCDVLLMPSIEMPEKASIEGFGMVYVEANMAGRYAVGANSGGIPDAIQEGVTGHLLANANPETIAHDICEIYTKVDKLYTDELIKARVEWARKHSFENIAKQYEKVMFDEGKSPVFWE